MALAVKSFIFKDILIEILKKSIFRYFIYKTRDSIPRSWALGYWVCSTLHRLKLENLRLSGISRSSPCVMRYSRLSE